MDIYKEFNIKYELTKNEKIFLEYLLSNNYKITKLKQYNSKMTLTIEKDNISLNYELTNDTQDINYFIKFFEKNFELSRIIENANKKDI